MDRMPVAIMERPRMEEAPQRKHAPRHAGPPIRKKRLARSIHHPIGLRHDDDYCPVDEADAATGQLVEELLRHQHQNPEEWRRVFGRRNAMEVVLGALLKAVNKPRARGRARPWEALFGPVSNPTHGIARATRALNELRQHRIREEKRRRKGRKRDSGA